MFFVKPHIRIGKRKREMDWAVLHDGVIVAAFAQEEDAMLYCASRNKKAEALPESVERFLLEAERRTGPVT